MGSRLNILVLAGTADARQVIDALAGDSQISITASLAGVTQAPQPLPVPVRTGGFGGAEGLISYCQQQKIDLILDITHPFARHISRNAAEAAQRANIRCFVFDRPAWDLTKDDRSFDSWQDMVDAVPAGERVFLAGGTASIEAFCERDDIFLCARALNIAAKANTKHAVFINAMPQTAVEDEIKLFKKHDISLLCCKNSGGIASSAKLEAARALGLPVWMLARRQIENSVPNIEIHDKLDGIVRMVRKLSAQKCGAES